MMKSNQRGNQLLTRKLPGNLVPVVKQPGRLRLGHSLAGHTKTLVAPAFYVGWQEGANRNEGFSLYTLLEAIPGHAQWSTVSGNTLLNAGFMLPSRETGREHALSSTDVPQYTLETTRTAA